MSSMRKELRDHVVSILLSESDGKHNASMRLRKVCPHCKTILDVSWAVCGCRHAFPLKRKAPSNTDEERVKCRKALESEEEKLCRKEQDRTHKASI